MEHRLQLKCLMTECTADVYWEKPENVPAHLEYQCFLNGKEAGRASSTCCQFKGLQADTEYDIEVRASFAGGEDTWLGLERVRTGKRKRRLDISKPPYNAVGDGKTLNTRAIQQAIEDCGAKEAVYIPEGVFLTGALTLHSGMELYLEKGAVLLGSEQPEDYLPKIPSRFEGVEMECYQSLLNMGRLDCRAGCTSGGVLIWGEGTIRGGGKKLARRIIEAERLRLKDYIASLGDKVLECENGDTIPGRARGRLIQICNAENVRISGLSLENGPCWNVHMIYCRGIVTDHCVFRSEGVWNGDGWDPDSSEDCTLFSCSFYTGDDSVAVKSGKNPEGNRIGRPCKGIRIFDCRCAYGHGIAMGSEMSGGIEDVAVWDCDLGDSVYGLEIKGTKKRGGYVRDIRVRDCRLSRVLIHSVGYNDDGEGAPEPPVFERCLFERVEVLGIYLDKERNRQPCAAIELAGFDVPGYEARDIRFLAASIGSGDGGTIGLKGCAGVSFEDLRVL